MQDVDDVVHRHGHSCLLSFDVEEGEDKDDPDDGAIHHLKSCRFAIEKVGFECKSPSRAHKPHQGHGEQMEGTQREEETEAEDPSADGEQLVE